MDRPVYRTGSGRVAGRLHNHADSGELTMTTYEWTYSSQVIAEEQMLDDLDEICAQWGLEERLWYRLKLVVSEAFCNAIVHGNELDAEKQVKLRLSLNENGVTADIIDQGYAGLRRLESRRRAPALADHGRGIELMRHYADGIEFRETPEGFLKVTLRLERQREANAIE
jgi:serine/threonine-protein kinase RsbW